MQRPQEEHAHVAKLGLGPQMLKAAYVKAHFAGAVRLQRGEQA